MTNRDESDKKVGQAPTEMIDWLTKKLVSVKNT